MRQKQMEEDDTSQISTPAEKDKLIKEIEEQEDEDEDQEKD